MAKNFRVRAAIFGRTPFKNSEFAQLYSILQKRKIESLTVSRGDVLTFGDAKVKVLSPEKDENAEAVSDNNHSLVLRIIYGECDGQEKQETKLSFVPPFLIFNCFSNSIGLK